MGGTPTTSITEEFRRRLEKEWSYYRKGESLDRDFCPVKEFYDTVKLREWMQEKSIEGSSEEKSNAERLLEEVRGVIRVDFPPPIVDIDNEERCFLLAFAILLASHNAHLIHLFQRANVNDKHIQECREFPSLQTTLEMHQKKFDRGEKDTQVDNIIQSFERTRWKFSPVRFHRGMSGEITADMILPFSQFRAVNKGGTAEVFHVTIPAAYVDDDLKDALNTKRSDKGERESYSLAIKSYPHKHRKTYEREVNAFNALQDMQGIIRQFGSYEVPSNHGHTYQIVLELSSMNLGSYFYEHSPPELPSEILHFWKSMLSIAKTISDLHGFTSRGPFKEEPYIGRHCDVKPGNILLVRNEWKLADFGFSGFELFDPNSQTSARYAGGTETFGAPEIIQRAKISISQQLPLDERIDVWSLGCVFSVAATWIAAGAKGTEDYSIFRWRAHQKAETVDKDSFHIGGEVLPEISLWHDYLKAIMRRSDNVTGKVLDMIEEDMLVNNERRKSSSEVYRRLLELLHRTEELPQPQIPLAVKKLILYAEGNRIRGMHGDEASFADPWIADILSRGPSRAQSRLQSHVQEPEEQRDPFILQITSAREAEVEEALPNLTRNSSRHDRQFSFSTALRSPSDAAAVVPPRPIIHISSSRRSSAAASSLQSQRDFRQDSISNSEETASSQIPSMIGITQIVENGPETFWAVERGSEETCQKFIAENPDVTNFQHPDHGRTPSMEAVTDRGGRTVIHHAILATSSLNRDETSNNIPILLELLKSKRFRPDHANFTDSNGFSPLFHCVWNRKQTYHATRLYTAAEVLIDFGASINKPENMSQIQFKDVLFEAIRANDEHMVQLLRCRGGYYQEEWWKGKYKKLVPKNIRSILENTKPERGKLQG